MNICPKTQTIMIKCMHIHTKLAGFKTLWDILLCKNIQHDVITLNLTYVFQNDLEILLKV